MDVILPSIIPNTKVESKNETIKNLWYSSFYFALTVKTLYGSIGIGFCAISITVSP